MNRKKHIRSILFALVLLLASMHVVYAAELPRLVDEAELLDRAEQEALLAELDEISERQQVDVVVVTTNTLDGKAPRDYANDFYDENGYGFGAEYDGILLLVSMEDRDWWISTCGFGITAFTDDGINYIAEQFLSELGNGEYRKGFSTYAALCDEFITQAKTGKPYDGSHMPKKPFQTVVCLLAAIGIGLVAALIATGIMKGKLKSVRMQAAAESYVKENSMHVTESRDWFLYSNIARREKPQANSSGGSSTHTSSSGRTHGGGGGKF